MTAESLAAGHAPLLGELAALRALARQVLEAHRAEDGRRLHEVSALVADLLEDLAQHLRDERDAAFAPAAALRGDHEQVRLLLADLRRHTQGFSPPRGACVTWRELWVRLAAFDARLVAQMDLEEKFSGQRA
ncbi:MAG TPA: hemerythrin domain-containing protein [Myxococcales bacterium]|nr:hemerythrin domain-containing protein [Myxococcales bacterium]